jgi:hypothetical protein
MPIEVLPRYRVDVQAPLAGTAQAQAVPTRTPPLALILFIFAWRGLHRFADMTTCTPRFANFWKTAPTQQVFGANRAMQAAVEHQQVKLITWLGTNDKSLTTGKRSFWRGLHWGIRDWERMVVFSV